MKRHIIITLEHDMGEYDDEDLEGRSFSPSDWEESFYQSDVFPSEMKIIGVGIRDMPDGDSK